MKTLVNAAFGYAILGLLSGFYYRELTKAHDFDGRTQLATVHTHLLVLGVVFLLVVLALEKLFTLSASPLYRWFTITFHAGLILTVAMLTVHGTMQVLGKGDSPAISGIAGIGHILLTVAFVLFFLALRTAVTAAPKQVTEGDPQPIG
ncbi:small-conductance mechanosensitive channel [Rhodococcus sp. LBL1]|nr:small-conductance mechanosensitive channel [Rhodococcus sp. LBL1]MDH6685002.1 small-conductance mechanosensitive channel [Rhodococcus sp. LBL2]